VLGDGEDHAVLIGFLVSILKCTSPTDLFLTVDLAVRPRSH